MIKVSPMKMAEMIPIGVLPALTKRDTIYAGNTLRRIVSPKQSHALEIKERKIASHFFLCLGKIVTNVIHW